MIGYFLLGFALVIIIFGLLLLLFVAMQRKKLGIVTKKRLYHDTDENPGDILYSTTLPLIGKPDYIIEEKNVIIPVEVKTGKTPFSPYMSHVMQLIAYCVLVEETYHKRPPYGIIRYPEKEFTIQFSSSYEQSLRAIIADMLLYKNQTKHMHQKTSQFLCRSCKQEAFG